MVQALDLNLLLVQLPFELLRTRAQGKPQLHLSYSTIQLWLDYKYLIYLSLPSSHRVVLLLNPGQILLGTPQWTEARPI